MNGEALTRRGILKGGAAAAALAAAGPALASGTPARPRLLPWKEMVALTAPFSRSDDRVAHLLHRTTFGVAAGELDRARQMGAEAWLDEQLHPERIDDSATESRMAEMFPTLKLRARRLFDIAEEREDGGYSVAMELKKATLFRAASSKRQLQEVMVEFWNNHFSVYHFKDDVAVLKTVEDREVIRKNVFGRFRDLLLNSARSPAMLYYLDNYANVAGGPNENYARELMELHTIGVEAGYTQHDVEEVARCFTGWTIDYREEGTDGEFLFDADSHDFEPKNPLGIPITGGDPGLLDGRRVLENLARHPSCARFLSTKICRRFVADVPPAALVDRAAAAFTASGGDVQTVLKLILTSDEFYASSEQKLRRPYEFLVAALRTLGVQLTPDGLDQLIYSLYPLGQVPFEWEPPNGYPDVGAAWANTNGLLNRWNLASALALNWFDAQVPIRAIVTRIGARTLAQFVDGMASVLLQRGLDEPDRARLIGHVGEGRAASARIPGWFQNQQAPVLISLILGSPYFQWR